MALHPMDWNWYKGQRYEVRAPKWRMIGRWTWIAYFETGKTLTGKTFRKSAAIEKAERAIKSSLKQRPGTG
jgi:hypothetical protein